MLTANINLARGKTYPAGRKTRNITGGASAIQAKNFCMGFVVLEASGGQVPWHNQEQEEVYFVIEGEAEMCLGDEKRKLSSGEAVYIPPRVFHQITNLGKTPLKMIYCYGPAGDVAHWKQELEGTLPRAGIEAPSLPDGARSQKIFRRTKKYE